MTDTRWQFWIDVGGTFTDCVAITPSGNRLRRKVLSSAVTKGTVGKGSSAEVLVDSALSRLIGQPTDDFWRGYTLRLLDEQGQVIEESTVAVFRAATGELHLSQPLSVRPAIGQPFELVAHEGAPLLAIRLFLGLRLDQPIPPSIVRLGTTRGTNALLTRRGARVAFLTTRGFADLLAIGNQDRPKLFELNIQKPTPLYEVAVEIDERIAADGSVLRTIDESAVREQLVQLRNDGIASLAVCLINAYVNASHEQIVERLAREVGFEEVSLSHRASPLMKMVPRGDTTVVDAYLTPVLRRYIADLQRSLPRSDLRLMTSAGGLLSAETFTGKDSILSGPAGGVVGFSKAATAAGFERAIGFDMGGTSTDVSRFDGRFEHEFETEKAGVRVVTPMLAIETVAAGGGSICRFDGVKLVVGPESAGADPGPACYGRGGPLTVTDCNVLLGRLPAERFPFPLDLPAVERRLDELAQAIERTGQPAVSPHALAEGLLRIANTHMAAAIRSISLAKGFDVRRYTLVPFGAAGPQHACAVADELGIEQILIPHGAGVLSAEGIGQADVSRILTSAVYRPFDSQTVDKLEHEFASLEATAWEELAAEGVALSRVEMRRSLDLRYQGVDAALSIDEPADRDYPTAFAAVHRRRYGYVQSRPLEVVAARLEAVGRSSAATATIELASERHIQPTSEHRLVVAGELRQVNLYLAESIRDKRVEIAGPAVVVDDLTTIVVDPGWQLATSQHGFVLKRTSDRASSQPDTANVATEIADPILLEVFNNRFTAIATQMGIALRNTASSVNVKERLDFSCAIFTAEGDLVVNAPHIPVHLGAMGETVKRIIADNPQMRPGDVFASNDPYRGGSHLPDVTVVTPVFLPVAEEDQSSGNAPQKLAFFTASRAHHAEIGGITPGSMPPFSRSLAEEGVLIRNFQLAAEGTSRLNELRELLTQSPWPSRAPNDNIADITAQMAANEQGASDLLRLVDEQTLPVVEAYMRHIQSAAERKTRQALARLNPGRRRFVDHLDDGSPIVATVDVEGETATIDFTGTGPVLASNLNANRAIVKAAVLYCVRLLIGEPIPLNEGVLAPIKIVLPECLLNPPERDRPEDCPAVVGGNVETSQRIVDVILGAFGLAAASQGTMNNTLFGDDTFGYYETICGGSGATATADGASAVHTHMTNTRLTDPEVLERRFPVRLREFAIRRGSGGRGAHRGGDGVRRTIEFLRPMKVSLLTQRRGAYPPYGANGGEPGAIGRNTLTRSSGEVEALPGQIELNVMAGDTLTIETPGGGGWGHTH